MNTGRNASDQLPASTSTPTGIAGTAMVKDTDATGDGAPVMAMARTWPT